MATHGVNGPRSSISERELGKRPESKVGRVVRNRPEQGHTIDLELGLPDQHNGYPDLATHSDRSDSSMAYQRVAFLHSRLLNEQAMIQAMTQEQPKTKHELVKMEDHYRVSDRRHWMPRQVEPLVFQPGGPVKFRHHRHLLLNDLEEKLYKFNSMVLQMRPLPQFEKPSLQQYISVRQFLEEGPDIHMGHPTISDNFWPSYELAVKELLRDTGSKFLDRLVNVHWLEAPFKEAENSDQAPKTLGTQFKKSWDLLIGLGVALMMQPCLHVLFWIGHITAALGFVLTANSLGSEWTPTTTR
ncbi:MAG: hypothetical protein Q9168_008170, partial [Polycauliona sp. 1 TL-2023]